ncbi:anti-sigma-I factor RsgI family protein [Clostridium sp. LBM24168]
MSKKEGIVISVNGKYANLLTSCGEFIKVGCNGRRPNVGEKFAGNEVSHGIFNFSTRKVAMAACIIFILSIGGGVKAYYSTSSTVMVNINPHIELGVNFFNRIIFSKALNNDGNKILSEIKINNANINDGLEIIIDQSKKDKFIDKDYVKTKAVSIDINGKNINISKFKSNVAASDLSVKIQSNGNVILNKNSNKRLNKSSNKNSNMSSSENLKTVNTRSNYRSSSNTDFPKKGLSNYNKSVSNKNNNRLKASSKQLYRPGSNRIKENQRSIKSIYNKNNRNEYNNKLYKGNSFKRNSSPNRHK